MEHNGLNLDSCLSFARSLVAGQAISPRDKLHVRESRRCRRGTARIHPISAPLEKWQPEMRRKWVYARNRHHDPTESSGFSSAFRHCYSNPSLSRPPASFCFDPRQPMVPVAFSPKSENVAPLSRFLTHHLSLSLLFSLMSPPSASLAASFHP